MKDLSNRFYSILMILVVSLSLIACTDNSVDAEEEPEEVDVQMSCTISGDVSGQFNATQIITYGDMITGNGSLGALQIYFDKSFDLGEHSTTLGQFLYQGTVQYVMDKVHFNVIKKTSYMIEATFNFNAIKLNGGTDIIQGTNGKLVLKIN